MVKPHTRRRADSGNVDRHTCIAVRPIGVPCKQPASPTSVKKGGGRWHGRCSIFVQQLRTEKQSGNVASAQNGCARPLYQDNSNNMYQMQGTIILETNFIHIYVLNYIFVLNILCISLYIIA